MACVTFDQGDPECDSSTTLMLPCQNNCDSCSDGVMNGDETDIDCGGSLCSLCPCTQMSNSLVYMDEVIPDGTDEHLKVSILTNGSVITGSNSSVNLKAGIEVLFNPGFQTGAQSELTVIIEECEIR